MPLSSQDAQGGTFGVVYALRERVSRLEGSAGLLLRVTGNRADNRAGRHAENSIEQHKRPGRILGGLALGLLA